MNKPSAEVSGIHQSDNCLCFIREEAVKLEQAGFGDSILSEICESMLKGKTGTIISRCFDEIF